MESAVAVPPSLPERVHARIARATGSPWFWVTFVAILFAYPLVGALNRKLPDPPPVMFQIPEFTLTDHLGQPFGTKDLTGKVWVANFIFTSCKTRCPMLTESMKKIQKRMRNMGNAVYLVSFSVDLENDTPQKLKEYADRFHVNFRRWRLVTGDIDAVKDAVIKGFKMPMDPQFETDAQTTILDITHGTRFVLVDQRGRVRGFYESDDSGMDQLVQDLSIVTSVEGASL